MAEQVWMVRRADWPPGKWEPIKSARPPGWVSEFHALFDVDALYAAWHAAGVDVAGGDWKRFIAHLHNF